MSARRPRHFLSLADLTPAELSRLIERGIELKAMRRARETHEPLKSRVLAMVYEKSSTRTRVSFETAMIQLGGQAIFLSAHDTQLGRGEPVEDTTRVLDRQVRAIVWRTFGQERVAAMAAVSGVPVVNALTDLFHPCQILADLQTVRAHKGALAGLTLTYLGDGANNMAHSYLLGGALAGMHVRIGSPDGYEPNPDVMADAARLASTTGGSVAYVTSPQSAVEAADVVATDTWVSMGQEAGAADRSSPFIPYAVDSAAMALADPAAVVLHCLPAYRGKEIAADVIDGPQSIVWDEAENRLHAQKALLTWLLSKADEDTP